MKKEASSKEAPDGTTEASTGEDENLRQSLLQAGEFHLDFDLLDDEDRTSSSDMIRRASTLRRWKSAVSAVKSVKDYEKGEADMLRRVLIETEVIALKRTSEGFNEINFTIGVLNCFLISYVIGAYPQHLWLLYLLESCYHIPRKFYNMWHAKVSWQSFIVHIYFVIDLLIYPIMSYLQPLNQALYYLDFCWCMNFLCIVFLALVVFTDVVGYSVEEDIRTTFMKAAMGGACGVLLSTNIALPFVACVFHDVNSMTALFIHLMPPMVMYTFMWHSDAILESWPKVFSFDSYIHDIRYFGGTDSAAACATAMYMTWWVLYASFILLGGINLPRKYKSNGEDAHPKWDTVFHSTMRQGTCIAIGKAFRGRSKKESLKLCEENDFDTIDFFIYMMFHMILALAAIYIIGYACFSHKYFHLSALGTSAVVAVIRGARRYTYYSTKMYARGLRKQFAHLIAEEGKEGYSRLT